LVFFRRLARLPIYLSKLEKIIILILLGVVLISTTLQIYDKFFAKKETIAIYGGIYTEGELGEIRSFLPILKQNDVEKDISKLIFSSLIKFNQKREIIGDLAEKWEISQDGKTYTFYLREAKWHDGERITADDVIYTFGLIQNEETKSPFFESLSGVEIKKIDDKTVSLNLKTPLVPFLSQLTIPILPKHRLSDIPPAQLLTSQFAKNPIGSGPFKLKKIEKNQKVTSVILETNRDYYLKRPYLDKFIFKIYQTQEEVELAFSKNQVLGLFGRNGKNGHDFQIVLPQYKAIFFNLNSTALDKDFRIALALSVNKDEILNNIQDARRIDFPILPDFLGGKEAEKWDFNLDSAKKYLAKSKTHPTEITLLTSPSGDNQKITEILNKQWEALGIKLNVEILTNTSFQQAINNREYDLLLIGVDQKADPDPYAFWHSSQSKNSGLNFSSLQNKEIDKLLEKARQTLDENLRKQNYERFVDIIQSEVPAIFLYQPIYHYRVNDIIKGIENLQGVTNSDRFWNVENWYMRTKKVKK
jgi:peptide/nickel transport system substrate-binding protein